MADISAIKLPNGTTYNLKDTTARNAANSAVPNTRTVNGKALSSNISLGAGDVGAYTKSETDTKINAAVASTYKYKGSVTADKLPTSGQVVGDVYNITNDSSYGKAGMNVAWNGTTWDALGSNVDLSNYITTSDSRLSNARPASDVYAWAKAENKPSYSWNEITGKPSTYPPSSHTHTKAQVGLGNVANLDQSKAIKSIIRSGTTLTAELDGTNGTQTTKRTTTFTATALDGTTTTFTQQDTNTTYGIATYSADGLMSKTDKAKLDGVADQASQLAKNTAQIETAGTATNAHSAGEYVMISNVLYKVTASVAKGDTWTIGTNVTAASVGSEIGSLNSNLAKHSTIITLAGSIFNEKTGPGIATGTATVVLNGGMALIFFDVQITTPPSATVVFDFGINIEHLRSMNASIPSITPCNGGVINYTYVNGTVQEYLRGYGGCFQAGDSSIAADFLPARVYEADGSIGGWDGASLQDTIHMSGVAIGTY